MIVSDLGRNSKENKKQTVAGTSTDIALVFKEIGGGMKYDLGHMNREKYRM